PLAGQFLGGQLAQFVIDQRQKLVGGLGIALLDGLEDAGDVVHASLNHSRCAGQAMVLHHARLAGEREVVYPPCPRLRGRAMPREARRVDLGWTEPLVLRPWPWELLAAVPALRRILPAPRRATQSNNSCWIACRIAGPSTGTWRCAIRARAKPCGIATGPT